MATYAIGDIQGCFNALTRLLDHIQFDANQDVLWFAGDIINRGPDSLAVLRYIKSLGDTHQTVLGNHDLHLLTVAYDIRPPHPSDTLDEILNAPDRDELLAWLAHRPLLVHDEANNYVMTHAGLAPMWDIATAKRLAKEVESHLQSQQIIEFLEQLYGNEPSYWEESLSGYDRLRCIVNYLTRMRFCDEAGGLHLIYKGDIQHKPAHLIPWFEVTNRKNTEINIIFGHWAALHGQTTMPKVYALDTGCIWGNCLTAMRLHDKKLFQVTC